MVTDESSDEKRTGGGVSRQSVLYLYRYSEKFEELCGYYLHLGMSYEDYWDGDATMVKYYRDKDEHDRDRENFNLWLQATYIYQALLDVAPALKPFVKHAKPKPFLTEPIPLNYGHKESKAKQEITNERKMENGKKAMMAMAASFNNRFKEKERENLKKGGEVNDGS